MIRSRSPFITHLILKRVKAGASKRTDSYASATGCYLCNAQAQGMEYGVKIGFLAMGSMIFWDSE
jgi:hypothetical protein